MRRNVAVFLAVLAVLTAGVVGAPVGGHAASQGFGSTTPGGAGGEIVRVTNLADAGPGSLREAIAQGGRTVVFDVAGEILLSDHLYVGGAFLTIDGSTAPAPGITLVDRGLVIRGSLGAHDVVVRGIRVRNASIDGIQVAYGAYNVVIDHVSIQGSADGDLDITEGSHDVTVSWSILAEPASEKTMLVKYNAARVSLHHNLFVGGNTRNPNVAVDDAGTPALEITADVRNNLVWDWSTGWGTMVSRGGWANVVGNFYQSPSSSGSDRQNAIIVCQGDCAADPTNLAWAYVADNVSGDVLPIDINAAGNVAAPFAAPAVDTQSACLAAHDVLAGAGVRPLDPVDEHYLAPIALPACAAPLALGVSPATLAFSAVRGAGDPPAQSIAVSATDGAAIAWSATVTAGGWLSVAPGSGTTPSAIAVQVSVVDLGVGTYDGTIRIEAPEAANSPIEVPVTLTIRQPRGKKK